MEQFGYTGKQILCTNSIEFATSSDVGEKHTEMNLGSYVLGMASDAIAQDAQLHQDMNIPEGFTPLFALCVGYDAEDKVIEKSMELTIDVSRA